MRKIIALALALLMCVSVPLISTASAEPVESAYYSRQEQGVRYEVDGFVSNTDYQLYVIRTDVDPDVRVVIGTATADDDGKLSGLRKTNPLAAGTYALNIYSFSGNGALLKPVTFETIAPVLSAPTQNRAGATEATFGFTTSEAGTAYYIIANAAPAEADYKDVGTSFAAAEGVVSDHKITLSSDAEWNVYVVVEDAFHNMSAPLTIGIPAFTTVDPDVSPDPSTSPSPDPSTSPSSSPNPSVSPAPSTSPGQDNNSSNNSSGSSGTSAIAPSPSPRPSATPAATSGITVNGEPSNIVFNEDGSVTLTAEDIANAGGSVVIGIPTERGGPTYVVVDIDGNIIPLSAFGDGYMYAMLVKAGTYKVVENGKDFNDIDGHWADEYIDFVTARELFLGTGGGAFSPDTSMTRAMFATVMSRIDSAELSAYEGSRFADVPAGEWYTQAVEWAAENGIVEGVGDGSFDPEAEITREEMAVMIGRYMRYANYDLPNTTDAAAFNDGADISSWAEFDVSIIQQAGIIVGKPGDLFDPQGIATRAEVATVITRFVEAILAE